MQQLSVQETSLMTVFCKDVKSITLNGRSKPKRRNVFWSGLNTGRNWERSETHLKNWLFPLSWTPSRNPFTFMPEGRIYSTSRGRYSLLCCLWYINSNGEFPAGTHGTLGIIQSCFLISKLPFFSWKCYLALLSQLYSSTILCLPSPWEENSRDVETSAVNTMDAILFYLHQSAVTPDARAKAGRVLKRGTNSVLLHCYSCSLRLSSLLWYK